MPTGTQADPVQSPEPMFMAKALMRARFRTGHDAQGLYEFAGDFYEWSGTRWICQDYRWLEDYVWNWSHEAYISTDGANVTKYEPNKDKVANIARATMAQIRLNVRRMPCWVQGTGLPHPGRMVAFDDVVVDVKASAEAGKLVTYARDENWFSLSSIPVCLHDGAKCDRWMQALNEWSGDDPEWIKLLQRWFGYCVMSHRDYAKMMLFHGKVRSGKGTISRTLRRLVGRDSFCNMSMDDLSNDFGLDGLDKATVWCINEASQLDTREGHKVVRILKNILGMDPVTVNVKHVRQRRNVQLFAAPMMSANEIPKLPNSAKGLSSKMVILPFYNTFSDNEQFDLETVLAGELTGIAFWALKGALDLEMEENPRYKFPQPDSSLEALEAYHLVNNPFDHFLKARFIVVDGNFVATSLIKREWKDWINRNNVRGFHVADNQLAVQIERESSWDVRRCRMAGTGERGMRGLALRKISDDEV